MAQFHLPPIIMVMTIVTWCELECSRYLYLHMVTNVSTAAEATATHRSADLDSRYFTNLTTSLHPSQVSGVTGAAWLVADIFLTVQIFSASIKLN